MYVINFTIHNNGGGDVLRLRKIEDCHEKEMQQEKGGKQAAIRWRDEEDEGRRPEERRREEQAER